LKYIFLILCFSTSLGIFGQRVGWMNKLPKITEIPKNEVWTYLKVLENQKELPDTIFGLATSGDFGWSGFFLSLCEYNAVAESLKNDKEPTPIIPTQKMLELGKLCFLKDYKGTTFSQLYLLKSLSFFGNDLKSNALWNSFPDSLKLKFETIADISKTYEPVSKTIVNGRPTNYFGVAAMIATYAWQLGFYKDRKVVDELLDHAFLQLEKNEGWLNDGKEGEFRFDRYHFEYLRFIWESAERVERKDLLQKLEPYLDKTDSLFLYSMHPLSCAAFPFGRSLQNVWEDNFEYIPFLLQRKNRSEDEQILFLEAFQKTFDFYFRYEYDTSRHHSGMLDPGRGCYSYVKPNRIFGYSFHSLGKFFGGVHALLDQGIKEIKLSQSPLKKFNQSQEGSHFFPLKTGYGIWILRSKENRIIIPIVTGLGKPVASDYQPIPFAEGISMPPVALANSHILPVWKKNGKIYVPIMKASKYPFGKNQSMALHSTIWASKTDTLNREVSPLFTIEYQYLQTKSGPELNCNYSIKNLSPNQNDSLVFSYWHSSEGPYEIRKKPWPYLITAPDFTQSRILHLPDAEEGKGAFTKLPYRNEFVLKPGRDKARWKVQIRF
jgi:hypothetical protein